MQTVRTIASFAAITATFALAPHADAQNLTRSLLFASPNHTAVGETVNLTAQVDGLGGGAPTGSVDFTDNGVALGSSTLVAEGAGQATLAGSDGRSDFGGPSGTHTCALAKGGGVKCWGYNSDSQLGDGTNTSRKTPVNVFGLSIGVTAVAVGDLHSCALTRVGGIKCWGNNFLGQLGDGTTSGRITPVDVVGLSHGVIAIAAGFEHTCALTRGGRVKCWGDNRNGDLGDGTNTARPTPVDVRDLGTGVASLATGARHTCALTTAGGVKCWGYNHYGQLGDGTTSSHFLPHDVIGLTAGVVALAAGDRHTCALTGAGGLKCWGGNFFGDLGDGTQFSRVAPVDVVGLKTGAAAVTAGGDHTCALTNAGGVKCWGFNGVGQLGDGTEFNRLTPVHVFGLATGVVAVTAGFFYTCAATSAGSIKCWGDNRFGQLGDGTLSNNLIPIDTRNIVGLVRAWAKLATSALTAGTHTLGMSYTGDGAHTGSTATATQVVK